MKKQSLELKFGWNSDSTRIPSFSIPSPSQGRLVEAPREFARKEPFAGGRAVPLSIQGQRWESRFQELLGFMRSHQGRLPRRKSEDRGEHNLAEWWRTQSEAFKQGKLSKERKARLSDAGLLEER